MRILVVEEEVKLAKALKEGLEGEGYSVTVAHSGEHDYGGAKVTESSLNGFPSNLIADRIHEDPYRSLVCADKFQTGYDEPLLQR